ncbi:TlpA family protein disulfide reductase [Halomontanus rarus]|uniref:TlpA family protein disulfide reductase n=1 Tax=Halomontanus rarus TaxID=3034020 RepID=UPI0023E8E18F|nr:TlpA disulfide reductase family protein [Halovivax sp. TS33]
MRRREILAGLGSVGAIGGAGLVSMYGLPPIEGSIGETDGDASPASVPDPITIETIDAPGSEDGEVSIPATDRATFIDFFGTWCPPCVEQMPALGEVNERIGESVRFVSVTTEAVGRSVREEEIVEWWDEHDGNWLLGIDPTAELAEQYLAGGYPSAVAIDDSGRVQWSESGVKTADELVAGIQQAIDTR